MFRLLHADDIRASDADREETAELLKRHYADGRLTSAELSARVEAAYAAVGLSQLDALTRDLPILAAAPVNDRPVALARRAGALLGVPLAGAACLVVASAVPPELWAVLLLFGLPIVAMVVFGLLPIALPLLVFAWLARSLTARPQARLGRGASGVGSRYFGELEPRRHPASRARHPAGLRF
jgi:hypothetical protein